MSGTLKLAHMPTHPTPKKQMRQTSASIQAARRAAEEDSSAGHVLSPPPFSPTPKRYSNSPSCRNYALTRHSVSGELLIRLRSAVEISKPRQGVCLSKQVVASEAIFHVSDKKVNQEGLRPTVFCSFGLSLILIDIVELWSVKAAWNIIVDQADYGRNLEMF
jgi:hypothetical protein